MRKVLTVARWEYVERVKSKIFLVSLILLPLIMISLGMIPGLLVGGENQRVKVIGLIDLTGKVEQRFVERMSAYGTSSGGDPLYVVRPLSSGESSDPVSSRIVGDQMVAAGELDGFCLVASDGPRHYVAEYRSAGSAEFQVTGRIQETLRDIVTEEMLAGLGVGAAALSRLENAVTVRPIRISGSGAEEEYDEQGFVQMFFSAYVFLMMLFFMILSSGQLLVRSVIEEKANRIVELLVSSCSATELMSGKVLGLSGLGFTQLAVWSVVAMILSSLFSFDLTLGNHFLLLILYFVLGYLLYAAIFIAVGSPVTTEQEAQHVTSYLVMVLVIPLVLTVPAIQSPDAGWIRILSYVPLLTPTMMGLRLSLQEPSSSEILFTVVIMLISIYLSMFAAGRIFRIAILATGKRPSIREVVRWIREGDG